MNRKDFDSSELGRKMDEIKDLVFKELRKNDDINQQPVDSDERRLHILAFWKSMSAIKGNLRSLSVSDNLCDYTIRTNRSQLIDALDRIFSGLSDEDPWYEQCKEIIRSAYYWSSQIYVLKWKRKNMKKTDLQFDHLKKIWDFCEYTDEEVLLMVAAHPDIHILYDGDDTMIESVGKMLS